MRTSFLIIYIFKKIKNLFEIELQARVPIIFPLANDVTMNIYFLLLWMSWVCAEHTIMPQLWFPMALWSGTSFPSTLQRVILCVWRLPSNLLAEDQLPCVCSCYFMDSHVGVCLRTRDWMKLWLNEGLCWAVSSLYQQCIHVAYWRTEGHERVWIHMVLFAQKMCHTLYSASLKLLTNKDRWKPCLFGFHFFAWKS